MVFGRADQAGDNCVSFNSIRVDAAGAYDACTSCGAGTLSLTGGGVDADGGGGGGGGAVITAAGKNDEFCCNNDVLFVKNDGFCSYGR